MADLNFGSDMKTFVPGSTKAVQCFYPPFLELLTAQNLKFFFPICLPPRSQGLILAYRGES